MRPTINSSKHVVHFPASSIASGVRANFTCVVVDNTFASAGAVREGATIKAVYVEMWVDGVTASKTVFGCITKVAGDGALPTYTETLNMGTYEQKKNVLSMHQGLAPSGGNQMAIWREWIPIPKGKQRFGLGDTLKITLAATGTTINLCGFVIFKEYY